MPLPTERRLVLSLQGGVILVEIRSTYTGRELESFTLGKEDVLALIRHLAELAEEL